MEKGSAMLLLPDAKDDYWLARCKGRQTRMTKPTQMGSGDSDELHQIYSVIQETAEKTQPLVGYNIAA